jgi:hypothetical protein
MERRLIETRIGIVLATVLIAAPAQGLAGGDRATHHETQAKETGVAGTGTLGGLWKTVKAREADLSDLIRTKQLEKVHEVAFAIRDAVAGMPEKSGQLPADQQAKLKGNAKYVATLAERLDAAGDAKDQTATEAGFKQLQSVLGAIEALYPAEALK